MNCEQALEAMQRSLDAGSDSLISDTARAHLERCSRCRSAWEALSAIESGLRELTAPPAIEPPEGMHGRIMAALERESPARPAPLIRRFHVRPALGLATAASLLVVFLATWLTHSRRPTRDYGIEEHRLPVPTLSMAAEALDLAVLIDDPRGDLEALMRPALSTAGSLAHAMAVAAVEPVSTRTPLP